MAGMRHLANHIIAVANENYLSVTNLQIQKIMFFALGFHIRKVGHIDDLAYETYDIPFEKWRYGPVVESVYYRFNHLRDGDITEELDGVYYEDYSEWDDTIIELLNIDVFQLVSVSHELNSWAKHEQEILNRDFVRPYSLEEIEQDFLE